MEEFSTKRGRITFGTEKIMMEESIKGYFKNSFNGFWEKGGINEKIFFLVMVGLTSFSLSILVASFVFAPIQIQFDVAAVIMVLALSVMIFEHWNNVDRAKFIPYDNISYVEYVEGMTPLTCPRFIVKYDKEDVEKTRYVVMPTKYMPGVKDDIESIKNNFEENNVRII